MHLMRYLNCWDNKNFWGAKFGPLTHAWAVNCIYVKYITYLTFKYFIHSLSMIILVFISIQYVRISFHHYNHRHTMYNVGIFNSFYLIYIAWPITILKNDNITISWDFLRLTAPAAMPGHLGAVSLKKIS